MVEPRRWNEKDAPLKGARILIVVNTTAQAKMRAALDNGDNGGTAVKAALLPVRLKRSFISRKPQ
jgi:6,7-dimethyl-8-ribityllumazine synthase